MWLEKHVKYWCEKLNLTNSIPQIDMDRSHQLQFTQYGWTTEGGPDEFTLHVYRQHMDLLHKPYMQAVTRYQREPVVTLFTLSPNVAVVRHTMLFLPHTVWFPSSLHPSWAGVVLPETISQVCPSQYVQVYREHQLVRFTLPDKSLTGWVFPVRQRGGEALLTSFYPEAYRPYSFQDDPQDLGCIVQLDNIAYFSIWRHWLVHWEVRNNSLDQPETVYASLAQHVAARTGVNPANLFERRAFGYADCAEAPSA